MYDKAKFVIFATCGITADQIYKILRSNFGYMSMDTSEGEDWKAFVEGPLAILFVIALQKKV